MLGSFDLDKTYQYLLISLAFLMPLTVSGANTIIVIICFLWLFSGDYKAKYNQIPDITHKPRHTKRGYDRLIVDLNG